MAANNVIPIKDINKALKELSVALGLLDKAEKVGIDCTAQREFWDRINSALTAIKAEFYPSET